MLDNKYMKKRFLSIDLDFFEIIVLACLAAFSVFDETGLFHIISIQTNLRKINQLLLILILIMIIGCFSLAIKKKCHMDTFQISIAILLLLRVPYFLMYIFKSLPSSYAYFIIVAIGPTIFLGISIISHHPMKLLIYTLKFMILLITVQLLFTFFALLIQGHQLIGIKNSIGTPLAMSNTLAAIILLQTILSYYLIPNKLYFFLSLLSLFCTFSKAGILSLAVVLILMFTIDLIKKHSIKGLISIISIVGLIAIGFAVAYKIFPQYFVVYQRLFSDVAEFDFSGMENGRLKIFSAVYKAIINGNLIFGEGLGALPPTDDMAHNFLLQSMFFGGIVGTLLYFAPIIAILYRSRRWKNVKFKKGLLFALMAFSIHGMVENVFFTSPCELVLWAYISLLYLSAEIETKKGK